MKDNLLKISKEHFETLFKHMPVGIGLADLNGKVLAANEAMLRLSGYSNAELESLNLKDIYKNPKDRTFLIKSLEKDGYVRNFEVELIRKRRTTYRVRLNMAVINPANQFFILTYAEDITEQKKIREELKSSEERLKILFDCAPDGYYLIDSKGRFADGNKASEEISGYRKEELIGKNVLASKLLSLDQIPKAAALSQRSIRGQPTGPDAFMITQKDGTQTAVEIRTNPVKIDGQTFVLGIARDINKRKIAEERLRKSEAKFRRLVENINDVLYITDKSGIISYISPGVKSISDYDVREIVGNPFTKFIYKDDLERIKKQFQKVISGRIEASEYRILTKSKKVRWVHSSSRPIMRRGHFIGLQGILTDISDRKQAEEKIRASLREKEVMLREIHHRVKNNMQIVLSLLRIQSRHIKNKRLVDMFRVTQDRIMSMSLIHGTLYRSKDLARIDFVEYIRRLTTHLFSVYNPVSKNINLKLEVEEIYFDINTAIPCGLIINELVSNSLKHAFPEGKPGEICVKINENLDKYTVIVKDTGIGFPENEDFLMTETLGMQLVTDLVKQLNGTIHLDRRNGTKFKITF